MINYTTFTLVNGMRVIHNYDSATAMVALVVMWRVGGVDDPEDHPGLAHLMEHLMFSGSINVPDFDATIEAAGGHDNAYTSDDYTCYYSVVPAQNAETAFLLESDRLLGLTLSEESVAVQRDVVIEEFKQQCLNRPYGDLSHHFRALAYKVHPYRIPVIGNKPEDIASVTKEDVERFYRKHYATSNAVIAISGNITEDRARQLAEKWFGTIPATTAKARRHVEEPKPDSPRHATVEAGAPTPVILVAFPSLSTSDPLYPACDILTDILANSDSTPLHRRLVSEKQLFTDIVASVLGMEGPDLMVVQGRLAPGVDPQKASAAIIEELVALRDKGFDEHQVRRAVNLFVTLRHLENLTEADRARNLASALIRGLDYNEQTAIYEALTPSDIDKVAREIIDPKRAMTLYYL